MAVTGINAHSLFLLETLISSKADADESLIDLHVLDALEAARRSFAAEAQGRTFRPQLPDVRVSDLFEDLRSAGNLMMGRPVPEVDDRRTERSVAIDLETLIVCLKQLERSAKLWNEEGGRKGYLLYIQQFLPK